MAIQPTVDRAAVPAEAARARSARWIPLPVLGCTVVPAGLVVAAAALQPWVPVDHLMRDPVAVAAGNHRFYYGLVSNLGVLAWCVAGTVCLFGAALLRRRPAAGREALFLGCAGLYSFLLLLDDLFLLHEYAAPVFLGVDERTLYGLYASILIGLMVGFRRTILATEPGLLLLALMLFTVSVASDHLWVGGSLTTRIVEDGSKFLGIAAWSGYFVRATWLLLRRP